MMNDESDFVLGLKYLLTSRLDECEAHFEKGIADTTNAHRRARSSFGYALVAVVRALISFEEDDKSVAQNRLHAAQKVAHSSLVSIPSSGWFFALGSGGSNKSDPKEYKELVLGNLDLELLSADAGLFLAMIQFTQESAMGIMRGALTLRKSFKAYQKANREMRELTEDGKGGGGGRSRKESSDFAVSLVSERRRREAFRGPSTQIIVMENELYFDAQSEGNESESADDEDGYGPLIMRGTSVEDRVRASSKMGTGLFHLAFSLIPPRFSSMIGSAMGFDTVPDRRKGLSCLRFCVDQGTSRSPLAALVLLAFHSAILILARGVSDDADVTEASEVLEACLRQYPDSPLFRFFEGRLHRGRGNLEQASNAFEVAQLCTRNIHQLAHLCTYERAWCAGLLRGRAREAGTLFLTVARNSNWAPAFYGYLGASFYYEEAFRILCLTPEDVKDLSSALRLDGGHPDDDARLLLEKALSWYRTIPTINRKRQAFPPEKFSIARSTEIISLATRVCPSSVDFTPGPNDVSLKSVDRITLKALCMLLFWPSWELAYMWNAFFQLSHKQERRKELEKSMELIRKSYPKENDPRKLGHEAMYRLFRGALLREESAFMEADMELGLLVPYPDYTCYTEMIEKWTIEFAKYERGLCKWEMGEKKQAVIWWNAVRDSGHFLDPRLKFRVKSALRRAEGTI